ncbi:MAG: hypothetical protein KTR25_09720 [Myxococcales bacterium]|nr:hypothetical protein [Myxococcales bacterium]
MYRPLHLVYVLIIAIELTLLSWKFTVAPPTSSQPLSIALGWAGLGSMVGMLIYVVARRSRSLRRVARLSEWLNLHIFLGVQGVTFVFFHSLPIFTREGPTYWANPAVVNFFAVVTVFCSGIFGRYLYSFVPKLSNGDRMALSEVRAELADLIERTSDVPMTEFEAQPTVLAQAPKDLARLAIRKEYLERRLSTWNTIEPIFRGWIIFHRPLAVVMYILSILHVVLTYMFTPSLAPL